LARQSGRRAALAKRRTRDWAQPAGRTRLEAAGRHVGRPTFSPDRSRVLAGLKEALPLTAASQFQSSTSRFAMTETMSMRVDRLSVMDAASVQTLVRDFASRWNQHEMNVIEPPRIEHQGRVNDSSTGEAIEPQRERDSH
jgi:hypothetical protein